MDLFEYFNKVNWFSFYFYKPKSEFIRRFDLAMLKKIYYFIIIRSIFYFYLSVYRMNSRIYKNILLNAVIYSNFNIKSAILGKFYN